VLDDGYSEIFQKGIGAEIGFDTYYETDRQGRGLRGDPTTVNLALGLLRKTKTKKPFFMWVHMFGVHGPDEVHEGAKVYGPTPVDRYDHEVSAFDREVVRLLDAIARRPRPTAVFITSDHGEALEPEPRHHGINLDEEAIRIPLIARVPGWPVGMSQAPVSLVDLVPTILALTETPVPAGLDGHDLRQYALNRAPTTRVLLSDTWRFDHQTRKVSEFVAAYDSRHKVVLDRIRNYLLIEDLSGGRAGGWAPNTGAASSLTNAVYGYLDETGGELRIGD
jgi:arylsulfatase A-like enzyme